jgi:hypothetical protein
MPRFDAASISSTSIEFPAAISRQVAGRDGWTLCAVQRFCQNARRRCLADPTRTREQIGVRDAIPQYRIPQRLGCRVLSHNLVKGLRTIFAGNHLVVHGNGMGIGL